MRRRRRWIISVGVVVLCAVIISTAVRAWLMDVYTVTQESMEPTLADAERILVDKQHPGEEGAQPGELVVFDGEGSFTPYRAEVSVLTRAAENIGHWFGMTSPSQYYVKRVIGADGDTVACCDEEGRLTRNGSPVAEPYLPYEVSAEQPASELEFEAEVPAGRIWVMGDNRAESVDSRALLGAPGGGMISEDRIVGRAEQVIWPWSQRRSIEEAEQ